MPTISEPIQAMPAFVPPLSVGAHATAIFADLGNAVIRPTRFAVLSRALDCGIPQDIAVEIAAMILGPSLT